MFALVCSGGACEADDMLLSGTGNTKKWTKKVEIKMQKYFMLFTDSIRVARSSRTTCE